MLVLTGLGLKIEAIESSFTIYFHKTYSVSRDKDDFFANQKKILSFGKKN